ncbi:hyaluronidase A-like isoform X2 [Arctopsyche grandis]|uniref:hyaluronidase A-like isoform X2 n=1 Tax=Arctopsyche grandis TaxID=121162 RepID=UPI00406D9AA5
MRITWTKANQRKSPQGIHVLRSPVTLQVDPKDNDQTFKVYWNSPTVQCHKHGMMFDDLREKYDIRQNDGDSFRGNEISILYDPGKFPALLEQKGSSDLFYRNGGVPQEGKLVEHMTEFKQQLTKLIPDENFNGIGIIDFESWRPVFRQNFGTLTSYKDVSFDIERENHPDWSEKEIKAEAARRFEEAGRPYMIETLKAAKEARPLAKWGYYAYPYCFNMNNDQKIPNCPDIIVDENNGMVWLWNEVDVLFPSVYMSKKRLNAEERLQMVIGRVTEAKRLQSISNSAQLIMPYLWYKYSDETSEFLSREDLYNAIKHMKDSGLNGVIIWGSSIDVNDKNNCERLQNYVSEVLGPVVSELTKS